MVQELVEEVLWVFIKNISRKIGATIRWVWFGRKLTFEKILEGKWNVRIGIIVLCLIFISVIIIVM